MRRGRVAALVCVASAATAILAASAGAGASPRDDAFRARIETIAQLAPSLPFSGTSMDCGWAVGLCSIPELEPTHAESRAKSGAHAEKVYRLWSSAPLAFKDRVATSPVGRVIVKDAWHSRAATESERAEHGDGTFPTHLRARGRRGLEVEPCTTPFLTARDGTLRRASKPAGLFVMVKLDPRTAGTDDGWIYGTVSTSGQVIAAGKLAECVACHHAAPFDHSFAR